MQHSKNLELNQAEHENEISLIEILRFLKGAWKTIAITSFLGLVTSSLYLLITPAQYEVATTIAMARVPAPNNVLGVNIEEPAALIARMSLPGAFNSELIGLCGFDGGVGATPLLAKSIKLAVPKGLTSSVELKVNRPTPELAKTCASGVVQFITASQEKMLSSLAELSGAANKARLAIIEERMSQDKALLAKAEQLRSPLAPTYFAVLSNIRALEDERVRVMAALEAGKSKQEALEKTSIQVSDKPIYPKRATSLFIGLIGGFFLGLSIGLVRRVIAKIKIEAS